MSKALERIAIAAVAAAAAFAIATATGQGGNERGRFIDIPRGQEARFLGTTTTCVNPKGQIPGGQVACTVNYRAPAASAIWCRSSSMSASLFAASNLGSGRASARGC